MTRISVFTAALLFATAAAASCAPDDNLCQGAERMDEIAHRDHLNSLRMIDQLQRESEQMDRYFDAREQSINQAQTNSLLMNLDRR